MLFVSGFKRFLRGWRNLVVWRGLQHIAFRNIVWKIGYIEQFPFKFMRCTWFLSLIHINVKRDLTLDFIPFSIFGRKQIMLCKSKWIFLLNIRTQMGHTSTIHIHTHTRMNKHTNVHTRTHIHSNTHTHTQLAIINSVATDKVVSFLW